MNMLVMEEDQREEQRELDDRLKCIPLCKFNFHIKKAQRHSKKSSQYEGKMLVFRQKEGDCIYSLQGLLSHWNIPQQKGLENPVYRVRWYTGIRAEFSGHIYILLGKNTGFSAAPPLFLTVTTVSQVITHSNQKPGKSGKWVKQAIISEWLWQMAVIREAVGAVRNGEGVRCPPGAVAGSWEIK